MTAETPNERPLSRNDGEAFETANDRFKRSFDSWFWGSMIAATALHFGLFALWPDMTAADSSFTATELEMIELPPEIEIPPPPQQISRPATPIISEADIDEDITIAPTTFEDNPIEDLPPPPEEGQGELSDQPVFTPYEVAPRMTNTPEVQRALERAYPTLLRDAGIGGSVLIWFFIPHSFSSRNNPMKSTPSPRRMILYTKSRRPPFVDFRHGRLTFRTNGYLAWRWPRSVCSPSPLPP